MFTVNFHANPGMKHHADLAEKLQQEKPHWAQFNVYHDDTPRPCNVSMCWSFHFPRIREAATPTLVFERGVVDMDRYTLLSLNLFGRLSQKFNGTPVTFEELNEYCKPIRASGEYTLIAGQCEGDYSLRYVNYGRWLEEIYDCVKGGGRVYYRNHPFNPSGPRRNLPGGLLPRPLNEPLQTALANAYMVIAYNSAITVDAAIAGVPVIWYSDTQCLLTYNSNTEKNRRRMLRELSQRLWPTDKLGTHYFWNWLKRTFD